MKYLLLLSFVVTSLAGFGQQNDTLYFSYEPLNKLIFQRTTVNEALEIFGDSGLVLEKDIRGIRTQSKQVATYISLRYKHLGIHLRFQYMVLGHEWQLNFKPLDMCTLSYIELDSTCALTLNGEVKFKESNLAQVKAVLGIPRDEISNDGGHFLERGTYKLGLHFGSDRLLNRIRVWRYPFPDSRADLNEDSSGERSFVTTIDYEYDIQKLKEGISICQARRKVKGLFVHKWRQKKRGTKVYEDLWVSNLSVIIDIPRKDMSLGFSHKSFAVRRNWKHKYNLLSVKVGKLLVGSNTISIDSSSMNQIEDLLGPAHFASESSDDSRHLTYLDNASTHLIRFKIDKENKLKSIVIIF